VKLESSAHLGRIRQSIAQWHRRAIDVAEAIADLAEPAMKEFKSSALLAEFLASWGFDVTWPWAQLPTAFRATAGAGRPRIALLAEYDALPDCGRRTGQWGHGCGHNLLGVGSALAGIASAETLKRCGAAGQIIVFGTPAEEALSGKVQMAEVRAFAGLDAVLAWHPSAETGVPLAGGLAMDSITFRFKGRTAHAAGAPHKGRSALDGAMLMDVAVNFLREHVEENARIHSVIVDGGSAPNVVPDKADIWYYVRGTDRKHVEELTGRVIRCARAAAIATETNLRVLYHDSVTERIQNRPLAEGLHAILKRCGPVKFTPADVRAAVKILPGKKYKTTIEDIKATQGKGSSDEDNVSWFAPLGRLDVTCVPDGTISHHRQYAAMVRTPGALKGMFKAAEYLAAGAVELALNGRLLRKVQDEFKKNTRGKKYKLPPRSKTH
jgi:aminobenzoyl-glutamate utilization protein B